MREPTSALAYANLEEIERGWPFLLALTLPGHERPVIDALPEHERAELAERIKRRGAELMAERDDLIRRGMKPMGASPAPTRLELVDAAVIAGDLVLELESDARQRLGLPPWTAPANCPRCGSPMVWDRNTSELRCGQLRRPPWRVPCRKVISYDADNLAWFPTSRTTPSGRGRKFRTLEPYHRPRGDAALPDLRAAMAAKWLRSQLGKFARDEEFVRHVEKTSAAALRVIRPHIAEGPAVKHHNDTRCPHCGQVSLVSDPRENHPVITCTSNNGPHSLITCRCPEGCSTCEAGERHSWPTEKWEELGWTKTLDPAVLKAVGLEPPATKKRGRKGRKSA